MAGKPKPMSQIKQLIRLYQAGTGKKTIARDLGLSKNTVKAYISKLQGLKVDPGELLSLDDPVLETRFHAGNPAYKDTRYEQLKPLLGDFIKELNKTGVTRHLLWEEYKELVPHSYSYSQFCYHLWQYSVASRPSMVLAHKPGEKLYIDFAGKKLSYTDPETGEVIYCEVFVACLPYSDYGFAMAVPSQRIEDFIYALGCCLHDLGGAPQVLVPDNLKSAIVKASHYEPDVNRALEDFANHYQCTVIPARAGKPKDKASELLTKNARFRYQASLEEIHANSSRGLEKALITQLATGEYINQGQAVLITGATGCGKSFLASALGHHACVQGYKVAYYNLQKLLIKTKMARVDGSIYKLLEQISKTDLLIPDDFGLTHLEYQQQMDIMEIIEDRHAKKATIIASQLPVASWYDVIGEETIADAILDRLVHSSFRVELKGDSLRKKL